MRGCGDVRYTTGTWHSPYESPVRIGQQAKPGFVAVTAKYRSHLVFVTRGVTCTVVSYPITIILESLLRLGKTLRPIPRVPRYFQLGTPHIQTADNSFT
ncbi:hypothetical protein TNCV_4694361 [Trichonephila clavipes]|uniref:Uncharacterized protein n=1 Tax=Trichonephila clavipes TaxID=2585209 RepID=A0A8X7BIG7_TRICX|nr:hypothetical protein TNCV_4694361 [Trichonephila clavipes]